jgi:hypothetical protein
MWEAALVISILDERGGAPRANCMGNYPLWTSNSMMDYYGDKKRITESFYEANAEERTTNGNKRENADHHAACILGNRK